MAARTVLLPDLDGEEPRTLGLVEDVLLSLRAEENEGLAEGLPPPLRAGEALAVQDLAAAVHGAREPGRPTQGWSVAGPPCGRRGTPSPAG